MDLYDTFYGELMLGTTVQTLHITIVGASLVSWGLSIIYHIFSIQNFQIKIEVSFSLFSNFEYYVDISSPVVS